MTTGRVVHAVRSGSFAGVERYVADVSNELARRGWDVDVIGGHPGEMARVLDSAIAFRPATTTASVMRALHALSPIPLVHAHMTAADTAAVLTSWRTRARIISTHHFAHRRGSSIVTRISSRLIETGIDREIAISAFVSGALGGHHTVLLNGVPAEPATGGGRTVLVIQRLEPEKDTGTAIRAFALSGLAKSGWTLSIAGRGSQLEELKALAARESVSEETQFLGFVHDPSSLRASAGIFLASAPCEPFGLAVVEAMSASLPVVAVASGGHLETLADAGFYFSQGNALEASQALRNLGQSAELQRTAGQQSHARYREALTLERHVDRLETIYAEVLS